jgi:hypothetical protein
MRPVVGSPSRFLDLAAFEFLLDQSPDQCASGHVLLGRTLFESGLQWTWHPQIEKRFSHGMIFTRFDLYRARVLCGSGRQSISI